MSLLTPQSQVFQSFKRKTLAKVILMLIICLILQSTNSLQIRQVNYEDQQTFLELPQNHRQTRLLLECAISDCVYCIKINSTQMCIVCSYPKYPNAALDQCQTPADNQTQAQTNSTIANCRAAQIMTLGIIKNQICTQCASGYRFLILQGQCYPVKDLNDSSQIISYGEYYYLCQEGCKKCEPTTTIELCFTCRDGYSMIEGAYICVKCKGECKECLVSQPSVCTSCFYGSVLNGSVCAKVSLDICNDCCSKNYNLCSSCRNSYLLTKEAICKSCSRGYFRLTLTNSSTLCIKCTAGCYNCESISQCSKCYPGFYKSGDQCISCKPNCLNCTSNQGCYQCLPGYDRFNGACIKPVSDCILMNNDGRCKVCKSQFETSPEGKCLASTGFDTNLVTIACKYGMFAQNYWCYSCPKTFPNCIECNSRYCLKCEDKYVLKDEDYTCQKCLNFGCKVCQSQTNCVQCESGYFMVEDLTGLDQTFSYGYCEACDKNCKTCVMQSTYCLECNDNYTLSNDRTCEGNYRLVFNITLNSNMKDFQSKVEQIRSQILGTLTVAETNSQRIKLTKIYNGSVVMEGYLHFENSSVLSTQSKNVISLVKTGNSLAGIQILAANFVGQDPYTQVDKGLSVGVILAISIPSGVFVISLIAVGVIIYRKCNNDDQKKTDSTNEAAIKQQINNPPEITASVQRRNDLPTILEQQSKIQVDAEMAEPESEKGIQSAYQYL